MKPKVGLVEIILLGAAVAIALALLIASLGAAAVVAVGQTYARTETNTQTFEGMITCSRCSARHQPTLDHSASNCVRVCVHGGASFTLVTGESSYLLDGDPVSLKRLAGQRARVTGTRSGNTIQVAAISSES